MSSDKKELARTMLKEGRTSSEVVQTTGLSREVVGGLKSGLMRSKELVQNNSKNKGISSESKGTSSEKEEEEGIFWRPSNAKQIVKSVLTSVKAPKKSVETILLFVEPRDTPLHSLDFVHILIQSGVKNTLAQLWGTLYRSALRDADYKESKEEYGISSGQKTVKKYSQTEVNQMLKMTKLEGMFTRLMDKLDKPQNPGDGEIKVLRDELKDLKDKMTDTRFSNLEALIKQQNRSQDALTTGLNRLGDISEKWIDSDQSTQVRGKLKKIRRYISEPLTYNFQFPKEKKEKILLEGADRGLGTRLEKYVLET